VALAFFLSLASYHPDDVSILNQRTVWGMRPGQPFGNVGASVSAVTFQLWGLNSFFLVYFFGIGVYLLPSRGNTDENTAIAFKWIGGALFMFFFPAWGSLLVPTFPWRRRPHSDGRPHRGQPQEDPAGQPELLGHLFHHAFFNTSGCDVLFQLDAGTARAESLRLFGGLWRKTVLAFYRWKNRKRRPASPAGF